MNQHATANAQCACGAASFTLSGRPVLRCYCHCNICQAFNQAAYSDITMFWPDDVSLPPEGAVEYRSYQPPGLVLRGKCVECGKPAIEKMQIPGVPRFLIVPTANIKDDTLVPAPALHMFYHRRVADVNDELPKFSSYLSSQLGSAWYMLQAIRRQRRNGIQAG